MYVRVGPRFSHIKRDQIFSNITTDSNFVLQFSGRYPPPEKVEAVWLRLGKLSTPLSKNHTIAAIYMIHIENFLHNAFPRSEMPQTDDSVVFSKNRWRILNHYADWVDCACGTCGRKWNFAVGLQGIQMNINSHRKCKAEEWRKAGLMTKWLHKDGAAAYEDNRKKWMGINK
jgi:hypothetical protein